MEENQNCDSGAPPKTLIIAKNREELQKAIDQANGSPAWPGQNLAFQFPAKKHSPAPAKKPAPKKKAPPPTLIDMSLVQIVIGIDPGVETGFATWHRKHQKLGTVGSFQIHEVMEKIKILAECPGKDKILVRLEDSRLRTWFGTSGAERWKGAGSVNRDCKIWENWLKDLDIRFQLVHPKNSRTKLKDAAFRTITKWQGRTNEHSRDAAMLIFGI